MCIRDSYDAAVGGIKVAKQHLKEVNARLKEEKKSKDDDILASLQMVNEMLQRGYEFLPIRIGKSRAKTYTAVSYTHLDVYKRQAWMLSARRNTACLGWRARRSTAPALSLIHI